jgi:sulfotransferase
MKMLFFLSGLPRTGSTLLTSIIAQNPRIHAEGNSGVLPIMRKIYRDCSQIQQVKANYKENIVQHLAQSVPEVYYKDIHKSFILDKNRTWITKDNWEMAKNLFASTPKVVVLYRPLQEIVHSFLYIREKNGWTDLKEDKLLKPNTDPIMYALQAFSEFTYMKNSPDALFVSYKELITDTRNVFKKIYKLFDLKEFDHNFDNIYNYYPEDDNVYNCIGLHEVRSKISQRDLSDVPLSKATISLCDRYEEEYGLKEFLNG